jgi:hypothetical protein
MDVVRFGEYISCPKIEMHPVISYDGVVRTGHNHNLNKTWYYSFLYLRSSET